MIGRAAVLTLGGAAAVAVALVSLKTCDNWQANQQREFKRVADSLANVRLAKLRAADSAQLAYVRVDTTYLRGRDILLNPPPGRPAASPEVKACFALSDRLRSACEVRHEADTAALHATERELSVWKARPDPINPRLQLYGEGLYDLIHGAPVFRAGAQFRVGAGVSLSAAGDLAIPSAGQNKVTTRGLVGIRYNFR